jgi:hypothetical protein
MIIGFHSQVTRLPFDGLGIAVLTNDDNYGPLFREAIKYRIIDAALGLEPVDWSARLATCSPFPNFLNLTYEHSY